MTPHRAVYHSPAPSNLVLILALASGAWLVLSAGIYLAGLGAVTTLSLIGGAF
jgi:hypothetical protein